MVDEKRDRERTAPSSTATPLESAAVRVFLTSLGCKLNQAESDAVARELARDLGELEWVPLKAMRKNRNERYRTPTELADDVRRYLNDEPLVAKPPTVWYRLGKLVKRNRTVVTAGSAVALALLVATVVSVVARMEAEAEKRRADREYGISRRVLKFVNDKMLASDNLSRIGPTGSAVSYWAVLNQAAKALKDEFKDEPRVEAELRLRPVPAAVAVEPHARA